MHLLLLILCCLGFFCLICFILLPRKKKKVTQKALWPNCWSSVKLFYFFSQNAFLYFVILTWNLLMWIGMEFITLIKLSGHEQKLKMGCQRHQTGVHNPRQMHNLSHWILFYFLMNLLLLSFSWEFHFLGYLGCLFIPEEARIIHLLASHLTNHLRLMEIIQTVRCSCRASQSEVCVVTIGLFFQAKLIS